MKKRKDYNEELKWNVKDLYKDEEAFSKSYQKVLIDIEKYAKYQGHILDNADTLYELLTFDSELSKQIEQLFIYGHIQNDQDTTDPKYQTIYGQIISLYDKYRSKTAFIVPEILKKSYQVIENYIKENPKLQPFSRQLKELFKYKKYTLSDKEEKIISNLSMSLSTPDDVFSALTDADLKFGKIAINKDEKIELTEKTYRNLAQNSNRNIRKMAFKKLYKTYSNYKNTYAMLLASQVKNNNKVAQIKGYDSALQASLYHNDIPIEVYTNLIFVVKKNISYLSKYWQIKKDALKVDKLHLYDTYAPIVKSVDKKYSLQEAQDVIMRSLNVLGEDYLNNLKKAFTERWIDFCPNDGKRNGAYCTACYNVHPYVLLSYDHTLENVSTLIHELGHALHYYYAIKNNSYEDYNYSIFVAEVASQVNQILLSKYLINNTKDKDFQKYLIDDLISDFKATIYRQTMFADFEKRIYDYDAEGKVLTYEVLNNIYYELNKTYFGKNIVVDKDIQYEWSRIPHFYSPFYVYQYATAYAAAIKIAMDILAKKENIVKNYLHFLSLGCTVDPINSKKVVGVDMLNPQIYDDAFKYFNDLIIELEKLYKEGNIDE